MHRNANRAGGEQRARQDIKSPSTELEQTFEKIESQINECARKFQ